MKYVPITKDTTLSELINIVGERNIDYVLQVNGLTRSVKIGQQLLNRTSNLSSLDMATNMQTKINVLNSLVSNSDVYEKAALGDDRDWYSLSKYGTFYNYVKIPDEILVPLSSGILGNDEPISNDLYKQCMESLLGRRVDVPENTIDPTIFNEYSSTATIPYGLSTGVTSSKSVNPFEWFELPWGKITLYSSISGKSKDFPVYPEEYSDGYSANYEQMPNMLYQYEPWQVYKDSGPRQNSFTFTMHRDMWTGDHRDGLANELVRFCEANCFPNYAGSSVIAPKVTLYLNGDNLITGVMTSCKVDWSGPLGLDGFYLVLKLTLEITEVSPEPLNYQTVLNKGLIK